MKRVPLIICLVGIPAFWGWAHFTTKIPGELPDRLCETFEVYRMDPAEGLEFTFVPIPVGQTHFYTFAKHGSYTQSIRVSEGFEMMSREGLATIDDRGVLTLTQRSSNRRFDSDEEQEPPASYRMSWGQDEGGEFLLLERIHDDGQAGFSMYMRLADLPASSAPSSAH